MTWEIVIGLFALLSAFIAVFNIVVKVHRSLCSLEMSVRNLNEFLEKQTALNEKMFGRLSIHDMKIGRIEERVAIKNKNTGVIRKEVY